MQKTLSYPSYDPIRRLASGALDLLFPPSCAGCGRPGERICATCAQAVMPVPDSICSRCGRVQAARTERCSQCLASPSPVLLTRAAGLHVSPMRDFIHLLKYEQRADLSDPLARYLVAALGHQDWTDLRKQIDAVVPVPLHSERLAERGYNQAELLARGLCRRTGLQLGPELLHRGKLTRSQVGLTAQERQRNVEHAFLASPACSGQRLLLIDDVYTTGATMNACAHAALAANAVWVCGLALAIPSQDSSMNPTLPEQVPALIGENRSFLCVSHVSPDGDAYGSLLGMCWLLRALGKRCVPAMHDPLLDEFAHLPGAETIVGPDTVGAALRSDHRPGCV